MDALIVIDMQEDLLRGDEKYELAAVVDRINRLAERVRQRGGTVIFVQHDGTPDDGFVPFTPGWEILSSIQRKPPDRTVHKTLNDAFFGTSLESDLKQLGTERVLITCWATDFCVDAAVRSATALGFKVVVVADGKTVSARPHLSPERVIEYHHWIWTNILSPHPVKIVREAEL